MRELCKGLALAKHKYRIFALQKHNNCKLLIVLYYENIPRSLLCGGSLIEFLTGT